MKKTNLVLSVAIALCATGSGAAFAQDRGHDEQHNQGQQRGHDEQRGQADNGERRNDRNMGYGGARPGMRNDGAGPRHDMHRGERLAPEYNNRQYVVDDWRGHRLSAPPRGYHWVQAGGDYVLVAITTGIIANILLNH